MNCIMHLLHFNTRASFTFSLACLKVRLTSENTGHRRRARGCERAGNSTSSTDHLYIKTPKCTLLHSVGPVDCACRSMMLGYSVFTEWGYVNMGKPNGRVSIRRVRVEWVCGWGRYLQRQRRA